MEAIIALEFKGNEMYNFTLWITLANYLPP